MKTHRWKDLRKRTLSAKARAHVDKEVARELFEMDLKAMRELLGITQEQLAEAAKMTQPEISRVERRGDHRLSTLNRIVSSLGGELEIVATFGDKRIRLRAAG